MEDARTEDAGATTDIAGGSVRLLVMWDGHSVGVRLPPRGELRVGRAKQCDVIVDHASVSRNHVVVEVADRVTLRDLGGQNGTRLGGRRLAPGESAPFDVGVVAEIGGAMLLLQRCAVEAAVPEPLGEAPLPPLPGVVIPDDGPMRRVYQLVAHVAPSKLSVLLLGETGVGKEVVCDAIHRWSPRRDGPLVRLNCAALPEPLLESELFGHERGAFTGAVQTKPGLIESADGGTLMLDELGDMPPATQVKLLRVLEAREVHRIGGLKPRPVDVRVVGATHRDLEAAIRAGTFRADLYYRLNGVSLVIPPLRARASEIDALAAAVARRASGDAGRGQIVLSEEALGELRTRAWPGNVRELRAVIERAVALSTGPRIEPRHLLDPSITSSAPRDNPTAGRDRLSDEMGELERRRIVEALARNDGNQSKAALELGIPRRTLVRRLQEYGLTRPRRTS